MARTGTIAVVALLLIPQAALGDWSTYKSSRVDSLIQQFMKPRPGRASAPALSIAIGMGGEPVLAKGFGEARGDVPASATTVYHIGSLTKQFTAAAVLRLIESGARAPLSQAPLTLETPMRDVFEGVERWTAADEPPITVRSLLTMTSNLPNFTLHPPREVDPWGAVETPRLLAALKKLPPHGWPNTFEYSNTSYFLLGRVIEASAPRPMKSRDFVRAEIIDRAGLKRTGFVDDYAPGSDVAQPHYRRRPAFAQPNWLDGCGDMASNVLDLFHWNTELMDGGIVSPEGRAAMFSDAARVDPVMYYGMGWFVGHDGEWDSYHHSGSVPGYTSYNAILRNRHTGEWLSVTLLTNSDGVDDLDRLADEIIDVARALTNFRRLRLPLDNVMLVQRCEMARFCRGNAEVGNEVQCTRANIASARGNASTGRLGIAYVRSVLPRSAAGRRDDRSFIWVFSAPGRSFFYLPSTARTA